MEPSLDMELLALHSPPHFYGKEVLDGGDNDDDSLDNSIQIKIFYNQILSIVDNNSNSTKSSCSSFPLGKDESLPKPKGEIANIKSAQDSPTPPNPHPFYFWVVLISNYQLKLMHIYILHLAIQSTMVVHQSTEYRSMPQRSKTLFFFLTTADFIAYSIHN